MEWVLIGGLVAVVALVAIAAVVILQRRRAGTIKAVVAPTRGTPRADSERTVAPGGEEDVT